MYADCFLIPIPKKNVVRYRKIALVGKAAWLEHGALDFKECIGDRLKMPGVASFAKLLKLKPSETCLFSWVTYKSKAHRDKVMAKVMADPRFSKLPPFVPFDMKKMHMGGFKVLVGG